MQPLAAKYPVHVIRSETHLKGSISECCSCEKLTCKSETPDNREEASIPETPKNTQSS